MRAGKLRHRVTLEHYQKQPRTESGAEPTEWVAGATVWAEVEQLRGRTLFAAQEAHSETTARIRLRWRADVAEANGKVLRIRHRGRVYRVDGHPIDMGGRRQMLEVMCHEWA